MKAGYSVFPQNWDWDSFEAHEKGDTAAPADAGPSDYDVWRKELELAAEVEDLGFDSIWVPEHHFTPYTMVPNPLQALTYFAGATKRVDVGTMVTVLPWHNPIRVVEEMIMLDTFLGDDRELRMGIGRGLGRREFGGFGVDMDESRDRFQEALDIIRLGLTQERFTYDGKIFQIPSTSVRPRPRDGQRLNDNICCAWGSPQTVPIAAANGLRPMVIPSKPFEDYVPELEEFARIRAEKGIEPSGPIVALWVYCAEDHDVAHAGAERYMNAYGDSVAKHYEFAAGHLSKLKTYEHYGAKYKQAETTGKVQTGNMWLDQHCWGTPEECIARIDRVRQRMQASSMMFVFKFGGMAQQEADASLRLFAREVLPAVHEMSEGGVVLS